MKTKSVSARALDVRSDILLSYDDIAQRWAGVHVKTVYKRLRKYGIKPHRISKRLVLFRLSDILKLEEDCA